VPPASWLVRALGFFSGTVGLVIKFTLLAVVNALAIWAFSILLNDGKWLAALAVAGVTLLIDLAYLVPSKRLVPVKFLIPGTIFLVAFVVVPIVSNANIAFTNWSTGHNLSKDEAIVAIEEVSLAPSADANTYAATPARKDGEIVLLLRDDATGELYAGSEDGLEPLPAETTTVENGAVVAAEGYEVLQGD
jgi:arabinogalactan oligomer/maltooligosaccharide transport system permease protein